MLIFSIYSVLLIDIHMSLCLLCICGCSLKPEKGSGVKGCWETKSSSLQYQCMLLTYLFHLHFSTYAAGDWQVTDTCSTAELNAQTLSCQHSLEDVSISMFLCTYKHCLYSVYNGLPVPKDMLKHIIDIFLFGLGV